MGSEHVTKGSHSGLSSSTRETSDFQSGKVVGPSSPLSVGRVDKALIRLMLICTALWEGEEDAGMDPIGTDWVAVGDGMNRAEANVGGLRRI